MVPQARVCLPGLASALLVSPIYKNSHQLLIRGGEHLEGLTGSWTSLFTERSFAHTFFSKE